MPNGVSNKVDGLLEATFMRVSLISVCCEDSASPNLISVILSSCFSESLRLITILHWALFWSLLQSAPYARPAESARPRDRRLSIVKSPNICCFVAKSVLLQFTLFLGVRFPAFDSDKYCQLGQWCYYYWFAIDRNYFLLIKHICYRSIFYRSIANLF